MTHRMLNPAVVQEAEWWDGVITEAELQDAARRIDQPLYLEEPPAKRVLPHADELQVALRAAKKRHYDKQVELWGAEQDVIRVQNMILERAELDQRERNDAR
jgi:hypothetical protein